MNRKQIIKPSMFRVRKKMMSKRKEKTKQDSSLCLGKHSVLGNYFNFINKKKYHASINTFFFAFRILLRDILLHSFL